jgi:hypothetical protein
MTPIRTNKGGYVAVSAISRRDVWAVGSRASIFGEEVAFAEHWDGKAWTESPIEIPELEGSVVWLSDMVAISEQDVWAVGYSSKHSNGGSILQTLSVHWDGETWHMILTPNVSPSENRLMGISVVTPNDIWAVGYYRDAQKANKTLVLHWDGRNWTITPSPNTARHSHLEAVAATGPDSAWAVGYTTNGEVASNRGFVVHWDGASWQTVPTPNTCVLYDVTALGSSSMWAVGGCGSAEIVRWDGKWNKYNIQGLLWSGFSNLDSVVSVSDNDAWVVGRTSKGDSSFKPIVAHWDGQEWRSIQSPKVMEHQALYDLSHSPDGGIWAVGEAAHEPALLNYGLTMNFQPRGCTTPNEP